jgi:hypothetical protein
MNPAKGSSAPATPTTTSSTAPTPAQIEATGRGLKKTSSIVKDRLASILLIPRSSLPVPKMKKRTNHIISTGPSPKKKNDNSSSGPVSPLCPPATVGDGVSPGNHSGGARGGGGEGPQEHMDVGLDLGPDNCKEQWLNSHVLMRKIWEERKNKKNTDSSSPPSPVSTTVKSDVSTSPKRKTAATAAPSVKTAVGAVSRLLASVNKTIDKKTGGQGRAMVGVDLTNMTETYLPPGSFTSTTTPPPPPKKSWGKDSGRESTTDEEEDEEEEEEDEVDDVDGPLTEEEIQALGEEMTEAELEAAYVAAGEDEERRLLEEERDLKNAVANKKRSNKRSPLVVSTPEVSKKKKAPEQQKKQQQQQQQQQPPPPNNSPVSVLRPLPPFKVSTGNDKLDRRYQCSGLTDSEKNFLKG